jgi:putative endopeptidase
MNASSRFSMKHCRRLLLAAPPAVLVFIYGARAQSVPENTDKIRPISGFDKSVMDPAADPCVDFYRYACGNFAKLHPIPADVPAVDQFVILSEFNTQALGKVVKMAEATDRTRDGSEQKVGDFYGACMDTSAIENEGLAPIQPELDRITALKRKGELFALVAHLNRLKVGAFFDFGSQQDLMDATREIAYADQGGLGLPERDYYLRTDPKSVEIQKQYVAHVANILKLLGQPGEQAQSDAVNVMKLETVLAAYSMGNVDRTDPSMTYHMKRVANLEATEPYLDWGNYIRVIGAPPVTELNVAAPIYLAHLIPTIQSTDLGTIRNYLRVHLIDSVSMFLPKAFDEETFNFNHRDLEGTVEQEDRWKRCVKTTDSLMGDALGQLYVAEYFNSDQKVKTLQMVHDIEAAMEVDLNSVGWLSPATRTKAIEKLHAVVDKIGYPNKWRDYTKLEIRQGDAMGNFLRAQEFDTAFGLSKIGKPVDRELWDMTPPTVNAEYDPSMNDIYFPAGILQPPFYDKNASDAVNYGHIGTVVAHELTHGFDDSGAKFDARGNLTDWWTPVDKRKFEARTTCFVNEYSEFTAMADVKVNGNLTLSENIADNGGVRLAYMALMARAALSGIDLDTKSDGYTPAQQFFLGAAQNACNNERPEYLRMSAQTDTHSPATIRVKGSLVNTPEFAKAFGCKAGQPIALITKCRIW